MQETNTVVGVPPVSDQPVAALAAQQLTKRFGELVANDAVNIDVHSGEVHVLLGENGAGKSTLMKMLYGVHQPDGGSVLIDGSTVELANPAQARKRGIGMVFQDFRLIPAISVLENITLSMPGLKWRLRPRALRARVLEVAAQYGLDVDPDVPVWQLDVGERQRVEILKVLLGGARVLIFDEPTSALAATDVDSFLEMVARLKEEGYGILLVTHKLREALACADRMTIMRGGQVVFNSDEIEGMDEESLVSHMVGRWVPPLPATRKQFSEHTTMALEAADLAVADEHGRLILQDVNFRIAPGEIVGVAGVSGNGQRELAEALLGLRPAKAGRVIVSGIRMTGASPAEFMRAGVAGVPENPQEDAVVPGLAVLEHMVLGGLPERHKGLSVDWAAVQEEFLQLPEVGTLDVAAPERQADQLSGGNVQRLVLARALARSPQVLIASYPSRGLDIATTRSIQNLLLERRDAGTGILLFSEDLSEIYQVADSIMVVSHGRMLGPIDPKEIDAYSVARMMVTGSHA